MKINKTAESIEKHIDKKMAELQKMIHQTEKELYKNKEKGILRKKSLYEYYHQLVGRWISYKEMKIDLKCWY